MKYMELLQLFSKERISVKIIPYDVKDKSTIQTIKTFRLNEALQ